MPSSIAEPARPSRPTLESNPESLPGWWTIRHTAVWELAEPSLKSEYQRLRADRYREQSKEQGPDDAVFQTGGHAARNVDVEHAASVSDVNWELDGDWEDVRSALRFGVGARLQYESLEIWNDELEQVLRAEWSRSKPGGWDKLKRAVRRGFEFGRGE
jgi:hypothetical protein